MRPDEAAHIIRSATGEDDGTFTLLRLGRDPGPDRVHELRLALRVLWRHSKARGALPFELTEPAAVILRFRDEGERNLRGEGVEHPRRLLRELDDLAMGAFELLLGRSAERDAVRRSDLASIAWFRRSSTFSKSG